MRVYVDPDAAPAARVLARWLPVGTRAGVRAPRLSWVATRSGRRLPPAAGRLAGTQQGLALRLERAVARVSGTVGGDALLAEVMVAADRVAYLAARDLLASRRLLGRLRRRGGGHVDRLVPRIATRQAMAADAIGRLEALVAALAGTAPGTPRERLRREVAVAQLTDVTQWVTARRQALAELDRSP